MTNNLHTNTVIIGASAAGLATAACLKRAAVDFVLLEQGEQVAGRWRQHYDRLHLHTNRGLSGLPYFPMPSNYPRYPSRDQVVAYLETYCQHFGLEPRFMQTVTSVEQAGSSWVTNTQDATYHSKQVVVATGYARQPFMPTFEGTDQFHGKVLHSLNYRSGAAFKGQSVLVVGFGNSGGEIAIDLYEQGAQPALAVRNAVNVVPRDLFGIPVLAISVYSPKTNPAISDFLFAPLINLTIGDITKLGLRKLPYGPQQQIKRDKHIPLLNIGTIEHIRAGHITVYPGIKHFSESSVIFDDGRELAVDAVVMATGYRPAVQDFLPAAAQVTDASGVPVVSGRESALAGLYFCGFYVSPNGMLREIGIEARQIAKAISNRS
ncbi:MAG: NAD(P)/FAD-dependent oxidoreductase [Anaerolineae bacterium]